MTTLAIILYAIPLLWLMSIGDIVMEHLKDIFGNDGRMSKPVLVVVAIITTLLWPLLLVADIVHNIFFGGNDAD